MGNISNEYAAIHSLVKNPRSVRLINVLDGSTQDVKDDGAAVTSDGVFPNGARQLLIRLLSKTSVGYAGKSAGAKPQRVFILAKPIDALYQGDPVAYEPVLDAEWQKRIDANVVERKAKLDAHLPAIKAEVASLQPKAAKRPEATNG